MTHSAPSHTGWRRRRLPAPEGDFSRVRSRGELEPIPPLGVVIRGEMDDLPAEAVLGHRDADAHIVVMPAFMPVQPRHIRMIRGVAPISSRRLSNGVFWFVGVNAGLQSASALAQVISHLSLSKPACTSRLCVAGGPAPGSPCETPRRRRRPRHRNILPPRPRYNTTTRTGHHNTISA